MAYNPNAYMPPNYQPYQTGPAAPMSQPSWMPNYSSTQMQQPYSPNQMQQPYDMRIKVKGRNGAEAFWMPANSYAVLLDADTDTMYYKSTDAAGYGTVEEFEFFPKRKAPQDPAPAADYVSRSEFDAMERRVDDLMAQLRAATPRNIKEVPDGE